MPKTMTMLTDHDGKPSSARGISIMAAVTFCGLAVAQAFGWAQDVAVETLGILAGMAVAPQALKGYFEQIAPRRREDGG